MSERSDTTRAFCTRCFADDRGGSWGVGTIADVNRCLNCGAGGSCVQMPEWAVDEIRQNASWVGKRYYAHEEDKAQYAELIALRGLVTEWPGRNATEYTDRVTGETFWSVSQKRGGTSISTLVKRAPGETPRDGILKARELLPYVPQ